MRLAAFTPRGFDSLMDEGGVIYESGFVDVNNSREERGPKIRQPWATRGGAMMLEFHMSFVA